METAHAQDTTQSAKVAEGRVLNDATKQIYYFRIQADSTVYIRQEGSASSDSALAIPATMLEPIFRATKRQLFSSKPIERVAIGYEGNNLILRFTQRFNLYILIALIVVIVVGGSILAWLWRRLVRERRRRETLARERQYLAQGREKERKRLAQEIHDGPVQDLHGLHMQVKARSGADGLDAMADELMRVTGELRALSADLHPPTLEKYGLPAALRSHADRLRERHSDLEVDMDLDEGDDLPGEYALAVFRVGQEAMSNAVQHGQADHLWVRLRRGDNIVTLEVRDDGDGFTPPDDWHVLGAEDHYGLLGMRERAEAIGADIEIESTPGEGTRVRLRGSVEAAHAENGHAGPPAAHAA